MGAFTRHLRDNGFRVGMPETEMALRSMPLLDVGDPRELRMALKAICAADAEGYAKFDDLFDAYWHNPGRSRTEHKPVSNLNQDQGAFSNLSKFLSQHDTGETGDTDTPDNDNHGEADSDGEGKLVSTETVNNDKTDMREFLLPEDRAMPSVRRIASRMPSATVVHDGARRPAKAR